MGGTSLHLFLRVRGSGSVRRSMAISDADRAREIGRERESVTTRRIRGSEGCPGGPTVYRNELGCPELRSSRHLPSGRLQRDNDSSTSGSWQSGRWCSVDEGSA